jgi:hypothetical protein
MIVINVDIMICIMCDVLLLKCAPSVVLMFKYVLCVSLIEYKVLYWSTSRPNDKVEMEKSYSCIMIFISITRNILLA